MKIKSLTLAIIASQAIIPSLVYSSPGYNLGAPIPNQWNTIINAEDYGVIANDNIDDSLALQSIIDNQINDDINNLTLIQLPAGEINLSDEIHIDKSGIVIKGRGVDSQTGTQIIVKSWAPYGVDAENAPDFDKKYWPGFGAFRVETRQKHANEPNYEGSINYHWKHAIEFAAPAVIGDTSVQLKSGKAQQFSIGDVIYIGAANDTLFLDKGQVPESRRSASHITTGHMRTQLFKVLAVDTSQDTIVLDRPLEFNLPLQNESGYKSRAMPVTAVSNFGLQDFALTMDTKGSHCENYNPQAYSEANPTGVLHRYENVCPQDAIHGIIMKWAYNGWVSNVKIEMIGSHPIVTEFAKDITIADNYIDGAWNKGAGGNGYVRGSKLFDSWIVNNTILNIRHLALQWSASGNLVEGNTLNQDINLHGGWERHNLIRQNVVEVPFEHRSWANGAPEPNATWQPIWVGSGDHASKWSGPTGPNNVLLNNTFKKAKTAGASISDWGLFNLPDVEYALGWNGDSYQHINIDGVPVETWNQTIAEDVFARIPSSGVSTAGGSWQRPMTDDDSGSGSDPSETLECQTTIDYLWKDKTELNASANLCVQLDRVMSGNTLQVWDSDADSSCDFRGVVTSVDGSGEFTVDANYAATTELTGSLIHIQSTNNCPYLQFRVY